MDPATQTSTIDASTGTLPVEQAPADPPAASPAAPAARVFTQVEVGQMLSAERKRVRDQVLREVASTKGEAPVSSPSTAPTPTTAAAPTPSAPDTRVLDFRDAIADFGIPRDRRRVIERFYLASGSPDPDGWLMDHAEVFGLVRHQPAAAGIATAPAPTALPPTAPTPTAIAPTAPPASDRGGPAPQPDAMRFDNPLRWTAQDVERIQGEKDTYAEGVRHVRNRFKQGLKGMTLELSRRGQ